MLGNPLFRVTLLIFWTAILPLVAIEPVLPHLPANVPVSGDYVLRSWDKYDGLSSNNVSGIAQTPDGYLWMTTSHGVTRFDGLRFTCFLKRDTPGLESDKLNAALVARNGALWVGLERGGVARFSSGKFQAVVPITKQLLWTSSFAEDAEGGIWFGYDPDVRVFRWQDGKLSAFTNKEGIGPGGHIFVYADVKGTIWYGARDGFGTFDGRRFKPTQTSPGMWPRLAAALDGGMWVTAGSQLLHYDANGKREQIADISGLAVSAVYQDHTDNLWIGTRDFGLMRYFAGSFVRVPTSHTNISCITEDREGNLWVGTVGGGLNCLSPRSLSLRQLKDGLHNDCVTTLCKDSEGRLWLTGLDGTPVRAVDATNHTFSTPLNWPGGDVVNMLADASGDVWFGTTNAGLIHWHNGLFENQSLKEGVTALLQDRNLDLWAATIRDGLIKIHKGINTYISHDVVQPRAIAEDFLGRIWVGTEKGLVYRREKDQFVQIPLSQSGQIHFIVPDVNDTVWIGMYSGGLYRWRAGQVAHLSEDAGLPSDDLRVLTIDSDNNFWFGTGSGLFRVARSELDAVLDGAQTSLCPTSYRRNDGLPSVEFSFGFRNAVTQTQDGHLWFATYSGALEVDPQKLRKQLPLASVLVEDIQLGGTSLTPAQSGEFSLPPNPGAVQINYTLPEMIAPEQIRFRYRLSGLGDGAWVNAGDQRTALFSSLPPGDYRFEVNAAAAGPWLPGVSVLAFKVRAAWWQTTWFRLGGLVLAFLLVGWIARTIELLRTRARMRVLEQEHALERERIRIARDMHDELGSSLTYIALLSELAMGETALAASVSKQLAKIVELARNVSGTLDQIVWTVNPRNDTLERLVGYISEFSREYLETAEINLQLKLQTDLPSIFMSADMRHQVVLVVREALNNIVKHSGAHSVVVKITFQESKLRIVIQDDGCGFKNEETSTTANGLGNMKHRTKAMGGNVEFEGKPGEGTKVTFEVHLKPVVAENKLPGGKRF